MKKQQDRSRIGLNRMQEDQKTPTKGEKQEENHIW